MAVGETSSKTDDGVQKVYVTHRPYGMTTYFTCSGDDLTNGPSAGPPMAFKMTSSDTSKSVDMTFNEDIYIKDGLIQFMDAPFGSYMDIEVVHPAHGVVGSFGRGLMMMGTWVIELESEDRTLLAAGLILRITCHNSDGTGDYDAASDFKVIGRLECYRTTTV